MGSNFVDLVRESIDRSDSARVIAKSAGTRRRVDFTRNVHCILGLPFDSLTLDEVVIRVRRAALTNTRCFLSTPNVNFVVAAQSDKAFRDSVLHSDMSIADGMPIVWMARLLGIPIHERVAGADLFERLGSEAKQPISVFFFGGPDGAAETASANLNSKSTGLRGVGGESPGIGTVEALSRNESIDRINHSGAQLLAVALGAKKGQAWIERNLSRIEVPVVSHLGAVVNFVGGGLRRAPPWTRQLGLEWCWRIVAEPTLWKRYWADGSSLLKLAFTRLLPLIWLVRLRSPSSGTAKAPSISVDRAISNFKITLSGTWTCDSADPLRKAFASATEADTSVEVIVERQSHLDLGIVALLLLLEGACSQSGRDLTIRSLDSRVAKLLSLCDLSSLSR
jgi:N-acetylglucosaminyldiphosphoundecaprenol N-acetyl-beta-D-mannosaminyltransferase